MTHSDDPRGDQPPVADDLTFTDFVGQQDNFGAYIVSVGVNASLDEEPSLIAVQAFNDHGYCEAAAAGICLRADQQRVLAGLLEGADIPDDQRADLAAHLLPALRRLAIPVAEPQRRLPADGDEGQR